MASSSWKPRSVWIPVGVTVVMGPLRRSTSVTSGVRRYQRCRRRRVAHDAGDRLAVQRRGHPVGLDVEEDVAPVERIHYPVLIDGAQLVRARRRPDRRPAEHVDQHRECRQSGGADGMRALRGADLAVAFSSSSSPDRTGAPARAACRHASAETP
jgi:hypothetical protein